MAAVSFVLTLSGVAQRLSDVYLTAGQALGSVDASKDIPYRTLVLQAPKAGADVYVGTDALVSSTVFGVRLDPTAAAQPIILGGFDMGPMKLSDFWVTGTSTQKMTVLGIPF